MLSTFIADTALIVVGVATIWLCFDHDKLKKSLQTLQAKHKLLKERVETALTGVFSRATAVENDCQNAAIRMSEMEAHYSDLKERFEDLKSESYHSDVPDNVSQVVGTATLKSASAKKKAAKRKK